ncbi:MAG: protein NO VEIN domain-containing protein [Opitutales bacterium]
MTEEAFITLSKQVLSEWGLTESGKADHGRNVFVFEDRASQKHYTVALRFRNIPDSESNDQVFKDTEISALRQKSKLPLIYCYACYHGRDDKARVFAFHPDRSKQIPTFNDKPKYGFNFKVLQMAPANTRDYILRVFTEPNESIPVQIGLKDVSGGGFGNAESNKAIEKAAVSAAIKYLSTHGWRVSSVETENRGYDLECCRQDETLHIEVKGVAGAEPSLFITRNEWSRAKTDPSFGLIVVVHALKQSRKVLYYSSDQFLRDFEVVPVVFRARLKG